MCSTFRCWRLYSWMRFTCTSNREVGVHTHAGAVARQYGQVFFVGALDVAPAFLELFVVGEALQVDQLATGP
jgi:hypothetical protein